MIKASGTAVGGRRLLLIGLDARNLERLVDNQPIRVDAAPLGIRPRFELLILGGPTVGSIREDLRAIGLRAAMAVEEDAGVLAFSTMWQPPGVPDRPIVVIGISLVAGWAMRDAGRIVSADATALARCADPVPRVLMAAAPDIDLVRDRIIRTHLVEDPTTGPRVHQQ